MALQLLDAIVAEFNLPSATPLGLAWDYHECCAREMEVCTQCVICKEHLLKTQLTVVTCSCRTPICVPSLPLLQTLHAMQQHLAAL
jgi:hypothetical protein